MKCIINGKLILKDQVIEKNIYFDNKMIHEISNREPFDEDIYDAKGLYVSPGFIDMHTHGRGGSDTMYPTFDDINTISKTTLQTGVTAFLPTTMTMSIEDTSSAIANVVSSIDKVEGSKILGIHMEGPFFNMKYKGAQPEEYMIAPTVENFLKLTDGNAKYIKKLSLAPELENCEDLIEYLVKNKVVVSMGHTNATYQDAIKGIKLGITSGTHTYNAMTPLTHRNPGVVGAIMENDDVYAELILDGIHVSYPAAKVLLKTKGNDKLTLITDSIEASGLIDGQYKLGNQPVFVKDNAARLEDGTLAGSILSMNDAVKHAYLHLGLKINEAVNLASLNPANCLNLNDMGQLKVGFKSDIIIFDENITINNVFLDGKKKI